MMADSAQQANNKRVTKVVLACVGSGTFLFLVLSALWAYQVYKHRGYHLKHLRKLDKEANDLNDETIKIRGEVDLDVSADNSTKLKNLEMLTSAEEWDTAILTALSAWGDLVEASRRAPGIVKKSHEKVDIGRKKGYALSIIGIMREKTMEGIERRKALSPQLQSIYADAYARFAVFLYEKMRLLIFV